MTLAFSNTRSLANVFNFSTFNGSLSTIKTCWLSYSTLSPVPFLHATADGMPAKSEKGKALHHLKTCFQPLAPTTEPVANVIDGNVQLYVLSPIPDNFQGVADMVLNRLAKSSIVYFLTDTSIDMSIKLFVHKQLRASKPFNLRPKDHTKGLERLHGK